MLKKIFNLGIVLVFLAVLSTVGFALPVTIEEVKVNNDVLDEGATNILNIERGEEITVKVRVKGDAGIGPDGLDNVQVEAVMRGSDHPELVEDITRSFRVMENVSYVKKLKLNVPWRLEQAQYKLRIRVEDRDGDTTVKNYEILIESKRHEVVIRDVVLNPENEVRAGRVLLAALRLENRGQKDEEGVKVRVSIPELGVSASDFVDEIEKEDDDDDRATSNELFLRIPNDAVTGEYTVRAEAFFNDLDDRNVKEVKIRVVGEEKPAAVAPKVEEKTVVYVPTDAQTLVAGGSEAAYPLTITNSGTASKTYVVTADAVTWGTLRVSPSNVVVVEPGQSKAVSVFAKANKDATAGDQIFLVTIKTDDKAVKQVPFKASVSAEKVSVEPATGSRLKEVLLVLVIVLLVIIVLVGIVFGFSKIMKGNEGKGEEEYY